jgi:hypothetical protein
VIKSKIFGTTEIVLTTNTRTSIDDCGRGVMFGGTTKTSLEGNT